jgi:hypothetical protein
MTSWRNPVIDAAAFLAVLPNCSSQDIKPNPTFGTAVVVPYGLRGEIYFVEPGASRRATPASQAAKPAAAKIGCPTVRSEIR